MFARRFSHSVSAAKSPPANWEIVWSEIAQFRSKYKAPVDTFGCDRLASEDVSTEEYRFQTLVSLMLSPQTRDPVTAEAMRNLQALSCSVDGICGLSEVEIMDAISNVSFFRRKAEHIRKTALIIRNSHDGHVPSDLPSLLALPGVGPKIAFLTLQVAFGIVAGIGVDTHVHRVSNRLGWATAKSPEATRRQLESWLPPTHWAPINALLVGFGQTHCTHATPQCGGCPVASYCPSNVFGGAINRSAPSVAPGDIPF
jgi:endonuclease III